MRRRHMPVMMHMHDAGGGDWVCDEQCCDDGYDVKAF